jgi:hypothetical protein
MAVPAGWSAPQTGTPGQPGYTTVVEGAGAFGVQVAVNGQTIIATVQSLIAGTGTFTINYGDTVGGTIPGSAPLVPSTAGPYEFEVKTDPLPLNPASPAPVDIASEPVETVVQDPLGDGTGAVTGSPVAKGTYATLHLDYTAGSTAWVNGTLVVDVPADWTVPQDSAAAQAGYFTVFSNGTGIRVTLNGSQISVEAATLPAGGFINIVYGDTAGGQNPGALAPSAAETEPFNMLTDPTPINGGAPEPRAIASEPTVTTQ